SKRSAGLRPARSRSPWPSATRHPARSRARSRLSSPCLGDTMARGGAVCRACEELVVPRKHDVCPRCGARVDRSMDAFEAWERGRLEKRIQRWHEKGIVDGAARDRLLGDGDKTQKQETKEEEEKKIESLHAIERRADALFESTTGFFAEVRRRYGEAVHRLETSAADGAETKVSDDQGHDQRSEEGGELGRATFGGGAVVAAGLG